MTAWSLTPGGSRYWPGVTLSAVWSYGPNGQISASKNGVEIPLNPSSWIARAKSLCTVHGPGVFAATTDPFYRQALLALSMHEDPSGALPAYADCWKGDGSGKVCQCGSANCGGPTAVGLYGAQRKTLEGLGFNWDKMATDPMENHRFALTLAQKTEGTHGKDFPTLAAIWGAGGVYNQDSSEWGNRTYDPHGLTEQVKCWNAIGEVIKASPPAPGATPSVTGPFGPPGTDSPAGILAIALVVYQGFKLGGLFK